MFLSSNLSETLGVLTLTGPGTADLYYTNRSSVFIFLLQVMTCGCQCGSFFFSRPRPAGDEWDL